MTTNAHNAGPFNGRPLCGARWDTTRDAARILRATAILFQCPASFRAEDANVVNLRRFFTNVERPDGVRFLWEPRGPWPQELIAELCGELALTHVVDPFDRDAIDGQPLTYWRLHGIGNAYHVYTDDELRTLIARLPPSPETYVMFNNVPRVRDAQRFLAMLRAADRP